MAELIAIAYMPFPDGIHEHFAGFATYSHEKKQYQIIINSRYPEERQKRSLKHEYGHIMLGHILSSDPEPEYPSPEFDAREAAADEYADNMTDAEFDALYSISKKIYHDKFPEVVMPA